MDRVSVAEAAQRLGISQDAVYKRIKRDTIPWDKGEDDKTYVYIDESTDTQKRSTDTQSDHSNYVSKDTLIEELRDRIQAQARELERKDTIIMALTQRIPELEPASEPRESVVSDSEEPSKGDVPHNQGEGEIRQSWWQRWFGIGSVL